MLTILEDCLLLHDTSVSLGRLCDCKMMQPEIPHKVITGNTDAQTSM